MGPLRRAVDVEGQAAAVEGAHDVVPDILGQLHGAGDVVGAAHVGLELKHRRQPGVRRQVEAVVGLVLLREVAVLIVAVLADQLLGQGAIAVARRVEPAADREAGQVQGGRVRHAQLIAPAVEIAPKSHASLHHLPGFGAVGRGADRGVVVAGGVGEGLGVAILFEVQQHDRRVPAQCRHLAGGQRDAEDLHVVEEAAEEVLIL